MSDREGVGAAAARRFHLVIGSHWDREWRESFEQLRFDLVRVLDHVIDGLESGRLRTPFVTDGQTSLLEDYLEIRPERRERVEALLASGALVTGPWFTMPDELLVAGESLVRNLELGRAQARALGVEGSRAGLVCDMFGHNSQLPQIFAGFGIGGALLWRGVNSEWRSLLWRGADGTELPTHRFGRWGYGSYAFGVRDAFHYRRRAIPSEWIESYLEEELAATPSGPILLFDSCDHQDWDETAYEALLRQAESWPADRELVHSDLDRFLAELGDGFESRQTVCGELREPGRDRGPSEMDLMGAQTADDERPVASGDMQSVIPGVASSRVYLKQANARCEASLLRHAEPLGLLGRSLVGLEQAPGFAARAWRLLLENHAHDSIGGCSADIVHRDMENRFDRALAISEKLADDALRKIGASVDAELGVDELRVTVFDPDPRPSLAVAEIELGIPAEWPSFEEFFGYERKPGFRIYDGVSGEELAYQRLAQRPQRPRFRVRPTKVLETVPETPVRVAVELETPQAGYRTLIVRAADRADPITRHPAVPGLATGPRSMANEHLAVEVAADGTLTVTDRASGARYPGLLTFEDACDLGDGWYHGPTVNDEVLAGGAAEVALLADGPLLARFGLVVTLQVPERFDREAGRRSRRRLPMRIETTVTLRRGAREVELHSEVVNPAADHRLRALFPTGAEADAYFAETPFDVVERPVALREDNHRLRELEVETRPQSSWAAVCEGGRGLAVVGVGLHESAVRDLPGRPIALTLFRSTETTAAIYREPEGQMLGRRLAFDYALVPLVDVDRAGLCATGQRLAAGLRVVQQAAEDAALDRSSHSLPAAASCLRLDGDVVLTALRQRGDSLELRAFNPEERPVEAQVRIELPLAGDGELTRLDGEPLEALPIAADGSCVLRFEPKQIATLRAPLRSEQNLE